MSFMSGNGERKVPKSADHRIDMKYLRVATKEGYAAGWFYDGVLPLDGVNPESVAKGKVGWIFSNGLHARLRKIQAPKKPAGNKVTEPFSIDIPVDDLPVVGVVQRRRQVGEQPSDFRLREGLRVRQNVLERLALDKVHDEEDAFGGVLEGT